MKAFVYKIEFQDAKFSIFSKNHPFCGFVVLWVPRSLRCFWILDTDILSFFSLWPLTLMKWQSNQPATTQEVISVTSSLAGRGRRQSRLVARQHRDNYMLVRYQSRTHPHIVSFHFAKNIFTYGSLLQHLYFLFSHECTLFTCFYFLYERVWHLLLSSVNLYLVFTSRKFARFLPSWLTHMQIYYIFILFVFTWMYAFHVFFISCMNTSNVSYIFEITSYL